MKYNNARDVLIGVLGLEKVLGFYISVVEYDTEALIERYTISEGDEPLSPIEEKEWEAIEQKLEAEEEVTETTLMVVICPFQHCSGDNVLVHHIHQLVLGHLKSYENFLVDEEDEEDEVDYTLVEDYGLDKMNYRNIEAHYEAASLGRDSILGIELETDQIAELLEEVDKLIAGLFEGYPLSGVEAASCYQLGECYAELLNGL